MLSRYLPIKKLLRLWSQVSVKDLSRRVPAWHLSLIPFSWTFHLYVSIHMYTYIYIYCSYFRDFCGVAEDVSFFRLWILLQSPWDPSIGRARDSIAHLPWDVPVGTKCSEEPLSSVDWQGCRLLTVRNSAVLTVSEATFTTYTLPPYVGLQVVYWVFQ